MEELDEVIEEIEDYLFYDEEATELEQEPKEKDENEPEEKDEEDEPEEKEESELSWYDEMVNEVEELFYPEVEEKEEIEE